MKSNVSKLKSELRSRWRGILKRCYNSKNKDYKTYGLRGIKVCDSWKNNFESFYNWSINNGYKSHLTLDRINNDRHYEPDNCQWITRSENVGKTQRTIYINYSGQSLSIAGWARYLDVPYASIQSRIKRGWSIVDTLSPINVVGLDNKPNKMFLSSRPSNLKLQQRCSKLLKEILPNTKIYEEVTLPGSNINHGRLRADFILLSPKLLIETNEQHHGSCSWSKPNRHPRYIQSLEQDKLKWAETNGFKLVVLSETETDTMWKQKILEATT